MLRDLIKNFTYRIVTLRFSILSIFITLFVFFVALLLGITSFRFEKTLSLTSLALMDQLAISVLNEAKAQMEPAAIQSKYSADLIAATVVNTKDNEIVDYSYRLVQMLPLIRGAKWGDEQGNFVLTEQESDGTISSEIYNTNTFPPKHLYINWDLKGNIVSKKNLSTLNYDPRIHAWYINAKKEKKTIWTNIYFDTFHHPILAITAASPVINDKGTFLGVFGLDIKLDYLINFVDQQKVSANGITYLMTRQGKMIAFPNLKYILKNNRYTMPDIRSIHHPGLEASLAEYLQNNQTKFILNTEKGSYLFTYRPVTFFGKNEWLIGLSAPMSDFTNELEKIHIYSLIGCLIILALGIYLVLNLVTRVVKPIQYLVTQTEKIERFELGDEIQVQSRIKEVIQLTNAIRSLQKGLRSFEKYVPKTLVRQLIASQEVMRVGGIKKELAVFFSDINHYSTIAETIDPNDLLIQTCDYFEKLTQIIIEERGTIDKYMGDSIMAIWGAPLHEEKPSRQAAIAALRCQKKLETLNLLWIKEEKYPFYTRIGIHLGETIVGNVGSSERLSYTAVGDNINIASRLEKLNKIYGTKIIVSESIYQHTKDEFEFRLLDCVAVKGKLKSIFIYELLGKKSEPLPFDYQVYNELFQQAYQAYCNQQWDMAIQYFNQCIYSYPEDKVAPLFIKRAEHFKSFPPNENWDGVSRLNE